MLLYNPHEEIHLDGWEMIFHGVCYDNPEIEQILHAKVCLCLQ